MVVAETAEQAVDAAGEVIVDYDPLPVVVDAEAALADGAAPSSSPTTAATWPRSSISAVTPTSSTVPTRS